MLFGRKNVSKMQKTTALSKNAKKWHSLFGIRSLYELLNLFYNIVAQIWILYVSYQLQTIAFVKQFHSQSSRMFVYPCYIKLQWKQEQLIYQQ